MSSSPHNPEMIPILTFALDGQYYALGIDAVVEVAAMVELTNTTDERPEVLGIANRHGEVLPVLDLRVVMKGEVSPIDEWTLFVVAACAGTTVGLVVDEVQQVEYVPAAQIHESSASGKYIHGIISYKQRLIQLVALGPLIADYAGAITDDLLKVES
jgi:purine-binding chemotaxis protein CheW